MASLPFTAEDVIAAFARHPHIQPCRGQFVQRGRKSQKWNPETRRYESHPGGVVACCGVTIFAIDSPQWAAIEEKMTKGTFAYFGSICRVMGWPLNYESLKCLLSFIAGFDGVSIDPKHSVFDRPSYEIGVRVASRLFPESSR